MARKFNYIRKLKSVLCLFRANITFRKDFRRKIIESDFMYKRAILSRFFTVLKEADTLGKVREHRLVSHLDRQRRNILEKGFAILSKNQENRQDKRQNKGLASLKNQRNILLIHFKRLKIVVKKRQVKRIKADTKVAKV